MDNYVQEMWQSHAREANNGKAVRVFAWVIGIAVTLSAAAYLSQSYWYPYISSYA